MKKRAFELKPGDLLVLANGQTAELISVEINEIGFGKHDMLLYIDGIDNPVLTDIWAELEVDAENMK